MDETEVFYKIIGLVKEHHKIVTELLSKLALNNTSSTSTDPNEALSEILKAHKDKLTAMKCLQYASNKNEVFDKGQVKPKIYIERLDSTVSLNLFMNIEGLIPFIQSAAQCTDTRHKQCPKSTKYHKCHQEKNNKKGYIPHTAWKQFHQCRDCKQTNGTSSCCICCSSCKRCGYCNATLPPHKQCSTYRLISALRVLLCFRNFSAHVTKARLKEFLDGKEELHDFPLIKSWKDLASATKEAYMEIVEFLSKYNIQPYYYKAQQDHRIQNVLDGTSQDILKTYHRCILEHCQRQEKTDDLKSAIKDLQQDMQQFIRIQSRNSHTEEGSYEIKRDSSRKFNEHEEVDFYYPYITREESEKLLEDEKSGAYLIRRSKSCTQHFVLTFKQEERCRHLHLETDGIYEEFKFVNGVIKKRFHTLLVACEEYLKTLQDHGFVPKPYIIQKSEYVVTQEEPDGATGQEVVRNEAAAQDIDRQSSSESDDKEEPPKRINENVEVLPWFFDVDRDGANEILKDENVGTYLLRKSTTYPGGFALAVKDIHKIEHIAISLRCEGQYIFPRSKTGLIFNSITRAIKYYLDCWSDVNKLLTQPYGGK